MQPLREDLCEIPNQILAYQIHHKPGLLDHGTICAFALVNRHLNKTVKESAVKRLTYLSTTKEYNEISQIFSIDKCITWHKNNSACTYWTCCTAEVDEREEMQVTLHLMQLGGNDTIDHHHIQCLPTDMYCGNPPLFNNYRPFFNAAGDACFHTFGQFALQKGAEDCLFICPSYRKYIFEYSICQNGSLKKLPCYVEFEDNFLFDESTTSLKNIGDFSGSKTLLERFLRTESVVEKLATSCLLHQEIRDKDGVYDGKIKIYKYSEKKLTFPCPIVINSEQKNTLNQLTNSQSSDFVPLSEDRIASGLDSQYRENEKKRVLQVAQFSEYPNLQKRLSAEIDRLLEDKSLNIDSRLVDAHLFEIRIITCKDTFEYIITCKISNNYPFKAPTISLETADNQLNANDLLIINKSLNANLSKNYSPRMKIIEIVDETIAEIRSFKNKRFASEQVVQGNARTIAQLKEKYLSKNMIAGIKYPELQKNLYGVWIKETAEGYGIFHVEGDFINIAFEPKYVNEKPVSYHGSYAAGHHVKNNNIFSIHISDLSDDQKTNCFQLAIYSDSISMMFSRLEHGSILEDIISHLDKDYLVGERIDFIKL